LSKKIPNERSSAAGPPPHQIGEIAGHPVRGSAQRITPAPAA
jgi:hypothetical protein